MKLISQWSIAVFVIVGLLLSACGTASATKGKVQPSRLEPIEGTDFSRVVLTEKAVERLDIQTALVREEQVGEAQRKVIPYAAVLYSPKSVTWAYTNPEPLVFVRQTIFIDYIKGDWAVLSEGPEAGTAVVTVGAAELFGAETGVSK